MKSLNVGIFGFQNPNNHGGLETYIRSVTDGLLQRGYKVFWNGTIPPQCAELQSVWLPRVGRMLPLMRRSRLRWIPRIYAKMVGITSFDSFIKKCDVVHFVGTGWNLAGFPLLASAKRLRLKTSCWPAVHPGTWGDSPLDIDLYNMVDSVFVQSDFEARHLANLGVQPNRFVKCGCASDSNGFTGDGASFRSKFGLRGKTTILFIGRKSREKGYHSLRQAIAQLANQIEGLTLITIGRDVDPPYPPLLPANELDLGAADEAAKHDALAGCDIFALPSAAESFGIVYVEAWRYGKPVICGTAPASRELIESHCGGLPTNGTTAEIQHAILRLATTPSLRMQLGKQGRKAIETHFNWNTVIETHVNAWSSNGQCRTV